LEIATSLAKGSLLAKTIGEDTSFAKGSLLAKTFFVAILNL
jgi:hypothetical protein